MKKSITRRALAGALFTTAVAAQAPPSASSGADDLQTARDENRHAAEALAKVAIMMETEPAFHFSA